MVYISERPRDTFSLWPQVGSECVLYSLYIAYAKKKTLKKKSDFIPRKGVWGQGEMVSKVYLLITA